MHLMQGVAITQENSLLDNTARIEGWLARFPMFDWVGGRTSEMSAVGLLPAALQVNYPYFQSCKCSFILIYHTLFLMGDLSFRGLTSEKC